MANSSLDAARGGPWTHRRRAMDPPQHAHKHVHKQRRGSPSWTQQSRGCWQPYIHKPQACTNMSGGGRAGATVRAPSGPAAGEAFHTLANGVQRRTTRIQQWARRGTKGMRDSCMYASLRHHPPLDIQREASPCTKTSAPMWSEACVRDRLSLRVCAVDMLYLLQSRNH